jgi:hypothetical protein
LTFRLRLVYIFLVIATAWVAAFGSLFSDHIFLDSYVDADGEPFSLSGSRSAASTLMTYVTLFLLPAFLQIVIFIWHQCFCMVYDAWHPKVLPEYRCMFRLALLTTVAKLRICRGEQNSESDTIVPHSTVLQFLDPLLWCAFELYPSSVGLYHQSWAKYLKALFKISFWHMIIFVLLVIWKHLWLTDHWSNFWAEFKSGIRIVFSRHTYFGAFRYYLPKMLHGVSSFAPGLLPPPPSSMHDNQKEDGDEDESLDGTAADTKKSAMKGALKGAMKGKHLRVIARHQEGGLHIAEEGAPDPAENHSEERLYWRSATAADTADELRHFAKVQCDIKHVTYTTHPYIHT